ncbi:hypothetical protein COHA_008610 [Chlorella ohadii]|uniref:Uncharacterized protein n=1 Tax=Chlorella ohadii TaxID=2649997 RepID=A0AAD5DJL4_9CHLO|nr:hypothetical protein COHA_008610 [Chlorella ohadii]
MSVGISQLLLFLNIAQALPRLTREQASVVFRYMRSEEWRQCCDSLRQLDGLFEVDPQVWEAKRWRAVAPLARSVPHDDAAALDTLWDLISTFRATTRTTGRVYELRIGDAPPVELRGHQYQGLASIAGGNSWGRFGNAVKAGAAGGKVPRKNRAKPFDAPAPASAGLEPGADRRAFGRHRRNAKRGLDDHPLLGGTCTDALPPEQLAEFEELIVKQRAAMSIPYGGIDSSVLDGMLKAFGSAVAPRAKQEWVRLYNNARSRLVGLGRIAPYDKHAAAEERNAKHQADMEAASAAADQRKTRAVEALRNAEITPKSCP